jgi:TonB-dependent receptor
MSRLEVVFTPTPETPGSALAGSINLVPKSAFDRAKPLYTYSVAAVMRDRERTLNKTPGMGRGGTSHKVTPEWSASAIVPLNEKIGFTLSASNTSTRNVRTNMQHFWRGSRLDTNGAAFPDTTPDAPYLARFDVLEGYDHLERNSYGGSLDFRLSPRDRVSLGVQYGEFNISADLQIQAFEIQRVAPGNFSTTHTQGAPGQGLARLNRNYGNREDETWLNTLNYWHDGVVWKVEAGLGYSSSYSRQFTQSAFDFADTVANRTGLTLRFDDTAAFRPAVTVTDNATGQPFDFDRVAGYRIISANAPDNVNKGANRRVFGSVRREFDAKVPLTAKIGFSVDQIQRDHTNAAINWTYLGPDRIANNADNSAAGFSKPLIGLRSRPWGFSPIDWVDAVKMTETFRSNPDQFSMNPVAVYNLNTNNSKYAQETVASAYVRGDASFMNGRLKVVGGLRAEQTNIEGEGNRVDATANFQREANGNVILGSNSQPLLIHAANTLEAVQLTNVARGFAAEKEYLRWFPSINATYNISDNLVLRGGYFQSVGRPAFLQYAGTLTLPNLENPPASNNLISVNNVGVKAWDARSYKASLEYYFQNVGLLAVSGFYREIENFFGTTIFSPTPEFFANYGLDPVLYGDYDVSTQVNLPGTVRMKGLDINYKQSLTFLPVWAQGFQIFANGSVIKAQGANEANFAGYIPRSANWGITLSRPKFTLRARWNYESRSRGALQAAGRSTGPETYQWRAERLLFTFGGEYKLWKTHYLFFNVSNATDEPMAFEYAGPETPEWARRGTYIQYTPLVTIGVQGRF